MLLPLDFVSIMCIQGSSHSWLKKKDGSPFLTFQRPIIQSSWMARLAVTPYVTYTLPQHIFAPTGAPPAWKDPGGGGSGHVHFAMLTAQYKKQQLYGVMKTANCKPQSTYQMPLAEILKYQVPNFVQKISTGSDKPPILDYIDSFSL